MIKTFKHKGLKILFETDSTSKVNAQQVAKCLRLMDVLDASLLPEDMNIPGFGFHPLQGNPERYAVSVTGNYRITFGWEGQDAIRFRGLSLMKEFKRQAVDRTPTHPGAVLREDVLPSLKISKIDFARGIHMSRQMLYDILNESRPITTTMALRLAKTLGGSPNVWVGMQQKYDLFHNALEIADELEQIQTITM